MSRSAIIQARVRPEIKFAGEQILKNIGLTMTEAMELFLRRLIVDQKLPFEVSALDDRTIETIVTSWKNHQEQTIVYNSKEMKKSRQRQKRE